jgi:hypothetical protein
MSRARARAIANAHDLSRAYTRRYLEKLGK